MNKFYDINSEIPAYRIQVNRVGVRNLKAPVKIRRKNKEIALVVTIDCYGDLGETRKGANISRITDMIYGTIRNEEPFDGIEFLGQRVLENLFSAGGESSYAEIMLSAEYFMNRVLENGLESVAIYRIYSNVKVRASEPMLRKVSVEVNGMNACPCAMLTTRELVKEKFPDHGEIISMMPAVTHNQRNLVKVEIESHSNVIEIDDIISVCESVIGTPQLSKMGKELEGKRILEAHLKPMFVEDIVREISSKLAQKYVNLEDTARISVSSESFETLHPHNVYAEISTTMADLREKLHMQDASKQ